MVDGRNEGPLGHVPGRTTGATDSGSRSTWPPAIGPDRRNVRNKKAGWPDGQNLTGFPRSRCNLGTKANSKTHSPEPCSPGRSGGRLFASGRIWKCFASVFEGEVEFRCFGAYNTCSETCAFYACITRRTGLVSADAEEGIAGLPAGGHGWYRAAGATQERRRERTGS